MRRPLAADGRGDLGAEPATSCVEARADRLELGAVGGGDGDEHRRAPGFGLDIDDPQAVEGWIIEFTDEHQIQTLMDLSAQLPDLALDRCLIDWKRSTVGRPAAATTTVVGIHRSWTLTRAAHDGATAPTNGTCPVTASDGRESLPRWLATTGRETTEEARQRAVWHTGHGRPPPRRNSATENL